MSSIDFGLPDDSESADSTDVQFSEENPIQVLDLFSGTESFSEAFHYSPYAEVTSLDVEPEFEPDICVDIIDVEVEDVPIPTQTEDGWVIPDDYDVVLASPPCKSFSLAGISHHFEKVGEGDDQWYFPESDFAEKSIWMVTKAVSVINQIGPDYWWIENPRAMLRNFLGKWCATVTWCQYDDVAMKPTDLWGTFPETFEERYCGNGKPCHQSAPRGSKTGTQGKSNAVKRAAIPYGLSEHIYMSVKHAYFNAGRLEL